jgi:putative oxidoreductase
MLEDMGLLILRLVVGLIIAAHGAQKLFGWFSGPGLQGITGWLGAMGLRPAPLWAFVAGISEFVGGLLVALGLLTPVGSLCIVGSMTMAIILVHWDKGLWNTNGGIELPLTNLTVALSLALTGPGGYALDPQWGIALPQPLALWVGLALVLLGTLVALLLKAREEEPVHQTGHGRA